MRPHPFALPDEAMSANRYAAAIHRNDRHSFGRDFILRSFERETDSSGAAVSGEQTWI
jgi:hypothetical protein